MALEYGLVALGFSGVFCLLFGSTLLAYFSVLEEHRIVSDSHRPVDELMNVVVDDVVSFGRFRPMFFAFHFSKIALLGPNPFMFHAVTLALGVLTAFLFYVAARRIGADAVSAATFVLLFSVTGLQTVIWYQVFGQQETLGMFLIAAMVCAFVKAAATEEARRWDTAAITFMALAGLTKESFVVTIPALLLLRWGLQCWFRHDGVTAALRTLRVRLSVGVAIFAVELTAPVMMLLVRPKSYGPNTVGLSISSIDPRVWWQILTSPGLQWLTTYSAAAIVITMVVCRVGRHRSSLVHLTFALLTAAAWTVPQLVLYSHGMVERYLFPAIVAPAAVVGLGLSILYHQGDRWARIMWTVALLVLLPWVGQGMVTASEAGGKYAADTVAMRRALTHLADQIPPTQAIIVAADPATPYGYEATYAIPLYLKTMGSKARTFLWPVRDPARRTSLHGAVAEATAAAFRFPDVLPADAVGAVVVATVPTDFREMPPWFLDTPWRALEFRKRYSAFSLGEVKYLPRGTVSHTVLVHGEESPMAPVDQPLVNVAPSLRGKVGINPLLRTPWWGVEHTGSGAVLWLGEKSDGSATIFLWSETDEAVTVECDVVAGSARDDLRRTLELNFSAGAITHTERRIFDSSGIVSFPGRLRAGRNQLTLKVLDEATIRLRPDGDRRPLLVLLRRVTVRPAA